MILLDMGSLDRNFQECYKNDRIVTKTGVNEWSTMKKKIYYHDTDAGGVVYYANYLKYLEESRTEFLVERGISPHGDFFYAVRECRIVYKSPARYGDVIRVTADVIKITAAQIYFQQDIYHADSDRLLVTAEIRLVCLTPDFKPAAISDDIRSRLS